MPYYKREFGATQSELGLIFTAFLGTRCVFQYPLGWLGDRFDKKRVLLVALLFFVPLVAAQGYATSIAQIIWLRVGLGVVCAALTASIAGIAAERSRPGNRARVMGINTSSFSLGVAVGPLLGGFLTGGGPAPAFLWPAGGSALMLLVVLFFVPGDRPWRRLTTNGLD